MNTSTQQKSNKKSKKPQAQAPAARKETPEQYILRRVEEEAEKGQGLRINARLKNHFSHVFGKGVSGAATVKRLVEERFVTVTDEVEKQSGKPFPTIRMWVSPTDAILRDIRLTEEKVLRVDEEYAEKFETEHGVSVFETIGVLNRMRIGDERRPVIDLSSEEDATTVTRWKPKTFDFKKRGGTVVSRSSRVRRGRRVPTAEVIFGGATLHLEQRSREFTDRLGNIYEGVA